MTYSLAERVFIFEHYFASKSFAALREVFSNTYPGKNVTNKTTTRQLVTKFRDIVMCFSVATARRATELLKLRPYRFQSVHQLQQWDTAA
jgi:hypothetical protein